MTKVTERLEPHLRKLLDEMYKAQCSGCLEIKLKTEFSPDAKRWNGIKPRCKICHNRYTSNVNRLRTGWTVEDYDEAMIAQAGLCAICKQPETEKNGTLAADHCHLKMTRRGLLCGACNTGIGKFKDDPKLLRAAADYIERYL